MTQISQLIKTTKKYLTKYDYENVIKTCDRILERDSENFFALRFKAIAYSQSGNCEEAIHYCQKLYQLSSNDDIRFSLALLYEETGEYEKALSYYDRIENNNYIMEDKHKLLLIKMKEYDRLIAECDEKIKTNNESKNPSYTLTLGQLEEKAVFVYMKGNLSESYDLFKQVSDLYPKAKKERRNPLYHNAQWYNRLEYCLEKYSKKDFFKQFFHFDDDAGWNAKLKRNFSLSDYFVFSEVLIESNPKNISLLETFGNHAKNSINDYALYCFNKMLEMQPDNRNAIMNIITIYSETYSKDKALMLINSKLKYSHLSHELLNKKIELLESMTLYPEALDTYEQYFKHATRQDKELLRMKINYLICMELYALDLYNQDRLKQAYDILIEIYRKYKTIGNYPGNEISAAWYSNVLGHAIDQADDDPEKFFSIFYTPTGKQTNLWIRKIDSINSKIEPQKLIGNKNYFEILSEKNPNNLELALYEARKYYTGILKPSIALPLFDKVLKIDPNNKEVLNKKLSMLVIDNQYYEAYDLLTKIDIDFPVISYSLDKLVDFLLQNNEYSRAKFCLNIIFKENGDYETLKKLKYVWIKSSDADCQKKCSFYMDWIDIINHYNHENMCPVCGSKLTPIRYGVIWESDSGFKNGKYYASDKIDTIVNRPTDYCPECKKQLYMGISGIDITEDNIRLARYAKEIIIWLVDYIEKNPQRTVNEIEKVAYWHFSLDHEEFEKLIQKLKIINFITLKDGHLMLPVNYKQFANSINQNYNYQTKIFKNKRELEVYSNSCSKFKDYRNVFEYYEDIKISLMASGWHYTYEGATEIVKSNESYFHRMYRFKSPAYEEALERGYRCG